jgi:hypothetical protein
LGRCGENTSGILPIAGRGTLGQDKPMNAHLKKVTGRALDLLLPPLCLM